MRKVRSTGIFAVNAILFLASWACYVSPRGDEYLVLFVIPLLFIIAPYILTVRLMMVMLLGNVLFFAFYAMMGILDAVDVYILFVLLVISSGISYLVMVLREEAEFRNRKDISREEGKYNEIVKELESAERKGRIVEREMARISRLYEITKQLGSVLKFNDLLDAIFDFLENNFKFETAHLLIFKNGIFRQGFSKSMREYVSGDARSIDYKSLVEYMREKEFKQFFLERENSKEMFDSTGIQSNTFFALPLAVENISAVLAIEGATKLGYNRFSIVVSQIALELRKVELYEKVEELSIIDGLTGVYLRRYLMGRLEEEVDRAKRLGLTFSVGMIDIDNFKKCNDTYGHLAGDTVLKEVAARLKISVREVDMIARYGGEEFCVILPETTKDLAVTVAERLRKTVEAKTVVAFNENINVTVSVGITTYPEGGKDVTSLIDLADTALYKAKRKGRNMVVAI
ncbi:MAG: GGDEF domain-containing protein [Candidatus Omnitrophica bacterium]|nr:GGDEF domain-containing protein [Candidatus Omnitrophota bacterium]MBU1127997.1 GGDEF domain-containing protein [Candidatus Omnitrophota bacterium]MBU1656708.1 GGDEF domain-containing protein [Candidatus Omnitrophota bacterium]MBU1783851.1 GGDEF domain-containing protein [Candidatus Omnitrophota bacterium]MBU1850900.1 GGDEF domain-containing protein [Candidatus Omnitrophota bacterium]